ncbi:MAG: SPOR domain-containing protein [Blastocatellia bacterium]
MKVICPKCQFENQADSSRVVCARCATIVEVKMDQGTGFDSNGKRQTARLPFASSNSSNNSQPLGSQPLGSQPFGQNKDVYATRIGDDFDDVLDVPIQAQANYSTTVEAAPMFEDVFTAQSQDQTSVYDFGSYDKPSTNPIESFRTNSTRQRETADYTEPSEQEFMGWPVLPENSADEEEVVGSGRGALFARIGLIVGVFGVLCFLAYYFLGDFIAKRRGQDNTAPPAIAQNGNQSTNPGASNPSPPQTAAQSNPINTESSGAPVVTPKPSDPVSAKDPNAKDGQKPVVVPPVPAGDVGRIGTADKPKPAPTLPPSVPSAPNKGNLTIQVGSFKDQGEADARASRLRSVVGGDIRVVKADIPGRGIYFRLQVGGFASREAAANYGNQLRAKNVISDFIVMVIGK